MKNDDDHFKIHDVELTKKKESLSNMMQFGLPSSPKKTIDYHGHP